MTDTTPALALTLTFANGLVSALVDLLGEQLRSLDVGRLLEASMLRRVAFGGGGAVGLFMLGRWLRRTEVIFRALSTLGLMLMAFGLLSLLGVVEVNLAPIQQLVQGGL